MARSNHGGGDSSRSTSTAVNTGAGEYRLGWLVEFLAQDRRWRREIRGLEATLAELHDEHSTTSREQQGVGVVVAATLMAEVGDPTRFVAEAKLAKWCGIGAIALSSSEGDGSPNATASTSVATGARTA